mmetsp:Transcript_54983/g.128311  ORF Transcript_54983/g.128311 Transcript_54983/m.128311 type:complete len:97 (+) Transcript_54983:481-771(+)
MINAARTLCDLNKLTSCTSENGCMDTNNTATRLSQKLEKKVSATANAFCLSLLAPAPASTQALNVTDSRPVPQCRKFVWPKLDLAARRLWRSTPLR